VTVTEEILKELVVKSRDRVKAYGEVFTPRHMVDQMLDLVRDELEAGPGFLDKTFLGGWCRTGVYGAGVIDSGGREWFNGWLQFLNPVGVRWVWGLS
jgi:hypothetical protein